MRLAWFTPLPPERSGISRYSQEVIAALTAREPRWTIDRFDLSNAHDFSWREFTAPYDLRVYQVGNAECHEYMWPYLVRYPGLTVLHDAQLHQSRAAALLKRHRRADDYRAEFRFNHPDADPAIAELVVHGLAGDVLHFWPLLRTVVDTSRTVAVHSERVAAALSEQFPMAAIDTIPMGVPPTRAAASRDAVLERHGIPRDAIVFASIGRVTPEKRIGPALRALAALAPRIPSLRVVLVGEVAPYYDVVSEAVSLGVRDRLTVTGYVEDDALADYIACADACVCLRWPTNGETSASWLRCLAAGRPTIITDLAHTAHVPSLDPRTWAPVPDGHALPPMCVSVDILDEDHSLRLAIERLALDPPLRETLGARALEYWHAHHTIDAMADAYRHVITAATQRPVPRVDLPPHLLADGTAQAVRIAATMGVEVDVLTEARQKVKSKR